MAPTLVTKSRPNNEVVQKKKRRRLRWDVTLARKTSPPGCWRPDETEAPLI